MNIDGMGNLVVGPLVVAWDWVTLALWADGATVAWGISHLLIDAWYIVFVLTGLRRILNLPVWLAAALVLLWFAVTVPLSLLFFTA